LKVIRNILGVAKATRKGLLRTWGRVCEAFFESVKATYPELVEANIRRTTRATIDIFHKGETDDTGIDEPQYPRLPLDPLSDPVFKALCEVGAVRIHPSGDPIVEPTPAALIRGLARLALPNKFLLGLVNATREHRGSKVLAKSEFDELNEDLFDGIRKGIQDSLGENWFSLFNKASYALHGALVLPCTRLPRSQEFYEEGINFYRGQGDGAELFIFSQTSGLVIPREFRGDASKNHYRYQYFTKGILGKSKYIRRYQWERYRTAMGLAEGYEEEKRRGGEDAYRKEAVETLQRFGRYKRLAICEVDHFGPWKRWNTLIGPNRQQVSIRRAEKRLKIGHGVLYDVAGVKKSSTLLRDASYVLGGAGVVCEEPMLAIAACGCALLRIPTERLQPFINKSFVRRCTDELNSSGVRVIKRVGEKLPKSEVERVVDGLLEDGLIILRSVKK
jgi:hypothetical protein